MKTKTIRSTLAEKLEGSRLADEALDTVIACLAILNGEVATPAPLGRQDVFRDLRRALLHLYVALPQVDDAPSLRGALGRAKLLDEALEGPPGIKGEDPKVDEATPVLDVVDADFDEMERRPGGGGAGVILPLVYSIVSLLIGYAFGVWQ